MPNKQFLSPRYWLIWLGLGLLRCSLWLPLAGQWRVGRWLGVLMEKGLQRRRCIAEVNIKLCFPELNDQQRHQLVSKHFAELGISIPEIALAWWATDTRLRSFLTCEGIEHLEAAQRLGKGVILLGGHYTNLELSGRLLSVVIPKTVQALYRPNENPLLNHSMEKRRLRYFKKMITRDNIREMVRSLKANGIIWMAVDQSFAGKHSVFAPFFGIPVACNTSVSRLVKLTGAKVVPFVSQRVEHGYRLIISPALEDFPSGDYAQDAARTNNIIEQRIKEFPEQYYWIHRRFKHRPEGQPNPYDKS